MARGWESKSVEDQISTAEARKDLRNRQELTDAEKELQRRKDALKLERLRIIREMERAYMRRHLVMLERSLNYIESELERLEHGVISK